jgi:hypothetical protein
MDPLKVIIVAVSIKNKEGEQVAKGEIKVKMLK